MTPDEMTADTDRPPPLLDHESSGRMFPDLTCEVCGLEDCCAEVCADYDGGARTSGGSL